MPKKAINDISGKRFGRLLVVRFIPDDTKFSKFECLCDCGSKKIIMAQSMICGNTVSCGCFQKEQTTKLSTRHGENMGRKGRTKTYSSWASMMMRSVWGNHPSFASYGAKGIGVCERWHDFINFKRDMGERPEGKSIDRIDNTKGYSPENCRWATRLEQALNRSVTVKVVYEGRIECVYNLCNRLSIPSKALRSRAARRGNDYVAALKTYGINAFAALKGVEL